MLGVAMHITIKTLFENGYNKTKIAEIVGCSRKTVRRALRRMELGEDLRRKRMPSIIDPYEEIVRAKVTQGLTAVRIQRYQVHVARNVLAKVPMRLKQTVADDLRTIFYASSKKKALEYFNHSKERWEKELPTAVKCLRRSIERCLAFFYFPQEEWICLRTTNVIERLNKEFKRRTKPMEIVAGERACL